MKRIGTRLGFRSLRFLSLWLFWLCRLAENRVHVSLISPHLQVLKILSRNVEHEVSQKWQSSERPQHIFRNLITQGTDGKVPTDQY